MDVMTVVLLTFVVLVLYLSVGGPLPLCFGAALMAMYYAGGINMSGLLMQGMYEITNPVMLSIPLFIVAGLIMGESGIAKSLLDFVNMWVGRKKGGLGVVTVLTCAVLAAISGSALTGIAAIGPIIIPRMVEEGYPRGYATGLVTISSVLGPIIPPSITLILYGYVTDTSILACFMATLVPGLVIAGILSVVNLKWAKKFDLKLTEVIENRKEKRKAILSSTFSAIPALMFPVIIIGGIYGGIMTTSEAAAVSVIYAMMTGFFIYRGLRINNFIQASLDAGASVASIMLMIMLCLVLGQTLTVMGVPQAVSEALLNISSNKYVFLLLVNILFLILGMLVTDAVSVLIAIPLLFPAAMAFGIDPVHFGAIVAINCSMGVVTPPYCSALYLGVRIGNSTFVDVLKPTMVFFFIAYVPVLILVTYIPQLSLFLPRLVGL